MASLAKRRSSLDRWFRVLFRSRWRLPTGSSFLGRGVVRVTVHRGALSLPDLHAVRAQLGATACQTAAYVSAGPRESPVCYHVCCRPRCSLRLRLEMPGSASLACTVRPRGCKAGRDGACNPSGREHRRTEVVGGRGRLREVRCFRCLVTCTSFKPALIVVVPDMKGGGKLRLVCSPA